MSETHLPHDDASAAAGRKQKLLPSKIVSGIASSGGKIVSGGGHVVSEIAKNTGGKVVSSGGKAFHKISSPIESAVRKTVDKATETLHGNSAHSNASSAQASVSSASPTDAAAGNSTLPQGDTTATEDKAVIEEVPTPVDDVVTAPVPAAESVPEPKSATDGAITRSTEMQLDDEKSNSKHGGILGSVENVTNKLLVTPVKGAAQKVAEGGNKLLVSPVKGASKKVAEGGKNLFGTTSKVESSEATVVEEDKDEQDEDLPDVPPDATLAKMTVIIEKRLKDVSIPSYYDIAWSEGDGTNNDPLYGPWLKESGKQNITVGKWEFADSETNFLGNWDGEKYKQKRIVSFVFNKQIPFQIGPTLAKVKHTQYCRVEGKDKCVVAMTIEMQGVPYSDCFNVEIRWVATRSGKNDIVIQVGLVVDFVKSTIMAGKIRSGTTEQTTEQQVQLFRTIKKACGAVSEEYRKSLREEVGGEREEAKGGQDKCTTWISKAFPFLHSRDALAARDDEIAVSAKSAEKKMKEVLTALSDAGPDESNQFILDQLVIVNDALDKILAS